VPLITTFPDILVTLEKSVVLSPLLSVTFPLTTPLSIYGSILDIFISGAVLSI